MNVNLLLKGGLGNQLFQFATVVSYCLEKKRTFSVIGPPNNATDKFALDFLTIAPGIIYKPEISDNGFTLTIKSDKYQKHLITVKEKSFSYSPIKNYFHSVNLDGYFQSYLYFEKHKDVLRDWILKHLPKINENPHKNIIQVRLGDLITNPLMQKYHGVLDRNYFANAAESLNLDLSNFRIISDDPDSIISVYPHLFVNESLPKNRNLELDDLSAMAYSKHLIISNSTFGWWGAYLSSAKIRWPKNWFAPENPENLNTQNMSPLEWIRI